MGDRLFEHGHRIVVFVLVTTFSRKPFGTVLEVVLPMLFSYDVVDAVAGQRDVRRVRIHFAILVQRPLDVSTINTTHSVSTIDFDECDVECMTITNRL